MKSFTEHLIYERALDAALADAATKSYEIFRSHVLSNMSEAWKLLYDNCKVGSPIRNSYTASSDPETNARVLVSEFRNTLKGFDNIYFVNGNPSMGVLSADTNPSFLILPPQVPMTMFKKITNTNSLRVVLAGEIKGAGGTYGTSKRMQRMPLRGEKEMSTSAYRYARNEPTHEHPQITLGGMMRSLHLDRFVELCRFLLMPTTGRNKAHAEIKKFLNRVENDLNRNRSVYIHEYIHLLDDMRYRGEYEALNITQGRQAHWDSVEGKPADKNLYYKSDIEWNAYFQMSSGLLRDIVRTYLVAMTSDGLAHRALLDLGKQVPNADNSVVEKAFNGNPQLKNGLAANALSRYLDAKLIRVSREVFMPADASVFGKSKWSHLIFHVFRNETGMTVMNAWLQDPKIRRKFATRLYSTAQDLEKLVADYISGLKQGKVPSKGEWSAALARARSNEYHIMYDGALIFATDVYSPKKQYIFVNASQLIGQP